MTGEPRRALLTGGTGFLGRHVLAELADLDVWTLGRRRPEGVPPGRHLAVSDVGDADTVHGALAIADPDVVIHLAGAATGDLGSMYAVNAVFAAHLLAGSAARPKPVRVFLAGSAAEYGPVPDVSLPVTEATIPAPREPYGITKLAQTLHGLAAAERGLSVVVGRLYNVVGPGMPEHLALGAFAAQIARMGPGGGTLVTGDLDVERDFIDVSAVARVVVALATRADVVGLVDICSGVPTRLRRLVDDMVSRSGRPIALRRVQDRRGITTVRRHYGAALRLQAMGLSVPALDVARVIGRIVAVDAQPRDGGHKSSETGPSEPENG